MISSSTVAIPITSTTFAAPGNLQPKQIHYVDVGTSGGVWGLERGYCMMIGGASQIRCSTSTRFSRPWHPESARSRGPRARETRGTAELGYLHCGPSGAGHFVKMVHNGIEYGVMAAYAEGLAVLRSANVGKRQHEIDAETTPLREPDLYQYDLDVGDIAEVWRRGSVIASWLLDLTAAALVQDADSRDSRAGCLTPARGDGPSRPRSTRRCPCPF